MKDAQSNITLAGGSKMPQIGLGTWQAPKNIVGQSVETAVTECGYRHIDCAARYNNEPEIGQTLNNIFSAKKIKREEIFITSKLWNTEHAPENVDKACKKTLEDLKLDYLDLYLVHWGIASDSETTDKDGFLKPAGIPLHQTWEAMEDLVKKGLVKNIGMANFTAPMVLDLLAYSKIKPAINQIEIHPYYPQTRLVEFCRHNQINITCYSPLGSPGNYKMSGPAVLEDKDILQIAKKHQKSAAQIILRWDIQRGTIAIPKGSSLEHLKANISIFDFELSPKEMELISNLKTRHRYLDPADWWGIPYFD